MSVFCCTYKYRHVYVFLLQWKKTKRKSDLVLLSAKMCNKSNSCHLTYCSQFLKEHISYSELNFIVPGTTKSFLVLLVINAHSFFIQARFSILFSTFQPSYGSHYIFCCLSRLLWTDLPPPATRERPPGCKTVFVGGLPENANEQLIMEVFGQCGDITAIRKSKKNFCHIRFAEEFTVDKALFLSGKLSYHRKQWLWRSAWGRLTGCPNSGRKRKHVMYDERMLVQALQAPVSSILSPSGSVSPGYTIVDTVHMKT